MTTDSATLQVLLVEDDLADVALMESAFADHVVDPGVPPSPAWALASADRLGHHAQRVAALGELVRV